MKKALFTSMLLVGSSLLLASCGEKPKTEAPKPAVSQEMSTEATTLAATSRSGKVIEPTSASEFRSLLQANARVVIDFYAPWCGPCKHFAPKFDALAKEFTNITFVKVNTEQIPEISSEYGIRSIPTLILVKDGKEVKRPGKENLKNELVGF